METSRYLERALFYDQNPATAEMFEKRASQLFQDDENNSSIEIHIQNHDQLSWREKDADEDTLKSDSPRQDKFDSLPSSPVKRCQYSNEKSLRCNEITGMRPWNIERCEELEKIAEVIFTPQLRLQELIAFPMLRLQVNSFACGWCSASCAL